MRPVKCPAIRRLAAAPAFFTHAMFVDSGPAMCSGREVLGFPKEIGLLHVPRDPARTQSLTLDALTLGATRAQPGRWQPLLKFDASGGLRPRRPAQHRRALGRAARGRTARTPSAASCAAAPTSTTSNNSATPPTPRAPAMAIVRASALLRGRPRLAQPANMRTASTRTTATPSPENPRTICTGAPRHLCALDLDFEPGETL